MPIPKVREQAVDNPSRSHSAMSVAGRLAMTRQVIDHGLDEGQLNNFGIGRLNQVRAATSEQSQRLVAETGEAQRSRCSDNLDLIFVLERIVVPDTDTFHAGTKLNIPVTRSSAR